MPVRQTVLPTRGHVPLIGQLDKGLSAIEMAVVDERIDTDAPRNKLAISIEPSVLSVAFLCVLCVKFRKSLHRGYDESQSSRATTKILRAGKHFDGSSYRYRITRNSRAVLLPLPSVPLVPKGLTPTPLKAAGN
jgi:hypothetical protein